MLVFSLPQLRISTMANQPILKQPQPRMILVRRLLLAVSPLVLTACDARTAGDGVVSGAERGVEVINLHGDARIPATVIPESKSMRPELQGERFLYRTGFGRLVATGNAIVASGGTGTIHIIDASGTTLRTIGRPGDGPGEFRGLGEVYPTQGDGLISYDRKTHRISRFDSDGTLLNEVRAETPPGASAFGHSSLVGAFPDGGFLLAIATGPRDAKPPAPNAFNQAPIILFAVDSLGKISREYGEFAGEEVYLVAGKEGPFRGEIGIFGHAPYGYTTRFGIQGDRALVFDNRDGTIRALDRSGQPVATYRATWHARIPAKADWEKLDEEWVMQGAQATWTARRSVVAGIEKPTTLPAFREGFTASDGTIWLEPFHYWNGTNRTYVGFDTDGTALKAISLPYRDRLLDVDRQRVLVLRISEEGAERVEVVPLR